MSFQIKVNGEEVYRVELDVREFTVNGCPLPANPLININVSFITNFNTPLDLIPPPPHKKTAARKTPVRRAVPVDRDEVLNFDENQDIPFLGDNDESSV